MRVKPDRISSDDSYAVDSRRDDWFLSWLAVAFGLTIIICHIESGAARWSAAAWNYAIRVPGSPATWGIIILAAGLLLVCGNARHQQRTTALGYQLAALWFCVLASAAGWAMLDDINSGVRQANPLAVVAWIGFAYLYQSRIRRNRARP